MHGRHTLKVKSKHLLMIKLRANGLKCQHISELSRKSYNFSNISEGWDLKKGSEVFRQSQGFLGRVV